MKQFSSLKKIILGLGVGISLASIVYVSGLDYPHSSPTLVDVRGFLFAGFESLMIDSSPTAIDGTVKNARRLGGDNELRMQRRITGICHMSAPIRRINHDGTVGCDEIIYTWSGSGFGPCTAAMGCGIGTQTQVVNCLDDSGIIIGSGSCNSYLPSGSAPPTSQMCDAGPCGCVPSIQTIGTHTYNVPALSDGSNRAITSAPASIPHGNCTYTQTFACTTSTLSRAGGESAPSCTCDGGYSWSGATSSCVVDAGPPPPSCTDGIRNGTETGIDCGGSCSACAPPPPAYCWSHDTLRSCTISGPCPIRGARARGKCRYPSGLWEYPVPELTCQDTSFGECVTAGVEPVPVNGTCSTCGGYVEAPSCVAGTVTGALANDVTKQWTWTCQGSNGGANMPCNASAVPNNYTSGVMCTNLTACDFGRYYNFDPTTGIGRVTTQSSCFTNVIQRYQFNWNPITNRWDYVNIINTSGGVPRPCMRPC